MKAKKKLGIYIHIPFCVRKCAYCDFLSFSTDENSQKQYVDTLIKEIELFSEKEQYQVDSVFFGGGTPSSINPEYIRIIMECLEKEFSFTEDVEVSIEANPGTVSAESLAVYKTCGINRISFGVQSMADNELKSLGRIHNREDVFRSFNLARQAGFSNINIDLMSALPGQTVESFAESLRMAGKLEPEHISVYSLIIEEGTPFYELYGEEDALRQRGQKLQLLPDEETERCIYNSTRDILKEYGYERYEISNYAKNGFACRHNLKYWNREEYIGFGLGASSLIEETRFKKTEKFSDYLNEDFSGKEVEILETKDRMSEFMFLGLRQTEGISEEVFEKTFGIPIEKVYGEILQKLINQGLLLRTKTGYCLTDFGLDVSNQVFVEFI